MPTATSRADGAAPHALFGERLWALAQMPNGVVPCSPFDDWAAPELEADAEASVDIA